MDETATKTSFQLEKYSTIDLSPTEETISKGWEGGRKASERGADWISAVSVSLTAN